MGKTVVVLGATGLVGGHCLRALQARGNYELIRVLSRRPLPEISGAETRVVDFDDPRTFAGLLAVDQVICALGTTIKKAGSREAFSRVDFTYPLEAARAARARGATHFLLVSSLGANAGSWSFYARVKGELEEAVMALGFRSLSIFRPSLLLGERREFRPGEKIGKWLGVLVWGKYRPIHAATVAAAIVTAAAEDAPGIRIYESLEMRRHFARREGHAAASSVASRSG